MCGWKVQLRMPSIVNSCCVLGALAGARVSLQPGPCESRSLGRAVRACAERNLALDVEIACDGVWARMSGCEGACGPSPTLP